MRVQNKSLVLIFIKFKGSVKKDAKGKNKSVPYSLDYKQSSLFQELSL
jgi:hypothetical protein